MDECKPLPDGAALPRRGAALCQRVPARAGRRARHGRAVQVDPIKPTLKAPGTKRLKLNVDEPLSSFALNVNLRRYSSAASYAAGHREVFKGSLAMGFCDVVDAPCAYLTAGLSHLLPHGAHSPPPPSHGVPVHTRRLGCLLRLMVYRYTLAAVSSLASHDSPFRLNSSRVVPDTTGRNPT